MLTINDDYIDEYMSEYEDEDLLGILQEECAELIQAISKLKRSEKKGLPNTVRKYNIGVEMTHVLVSLNTAAKLIGIPQSDIDDEVLRKSLKDNFINTNIPGERT